MNVVTSPARSAAQPDKLALSPVIVGGETDRMPLIQAYMRIALRWRYVILGAVAGCFMLGLVITLLMTPQYTATATIEISRESNKVTDIQGVEREAGLADQEFYQTQYGLLQSRSLSERIAGQLGLPDDPTFFRAFKVGQNAPAFSLVNGRYAAKGRDVRLRVAGEVLRANLAIAPIRMSRLVDIHFTGPNAAFAAKVANVWAENFIQTNLERKVQATSYGRDLLERQLAQAKQKLDETQRQLVGYASAQGIINLPGQPNPQGGTTERSMVADELANLNTALAEATAQRIQAAARYEQGGKGGGTAEALSNQAINLLRQKRAELAAEYQRMLVQFEPQYPPAAAIKAQIDQLDRSIGREESRVSGSIQAEYRQALQREQQLSARIDQLKAAYLDQRRRSIQYNIYQQEVDTNRVLYDGLLQRYKEIGVAGGVGVNNISIVDVADVPPRPSSPRMVVNLFLALLAGLGLGAALALVLEQIDEAIADPSDIGRRLGLPLLGSVPKLDDTSPREALLDRKSEMVDAYIAVQTSLALTTEHGVPRSLAVMSTRPAEGKSTTALALATMLARMQRKVILIDGDMRSPSVHHYGGVTHDRGLSNFLSGEDNISSLTFSIADLGITAMSAGPVPPNAAELLSGSRLDVLIDRLLESYDNVVVDSPPVMGLADAPLIASRVEGVVYVVESHGIRISLVKTALNRLLSGGARTLGVILTKFVASKAHYGYGYEYGYGYGRSDGARKA